MSFKSAENSVEDMSVEEINIVVQPEITKSPSKKSESGSPH